MFYLDCFSYKRQKILFQVHIVCPPANATEFHRVMLVDRDEYETCRLHTASHAR
jgi:hypothetical protein